MRNESEPTEDTAQVSDRRGRIWTLAVKTIDDDDDLDPWLKMTPEERVEWVGECVLDGLRVKGQSDIPRLRRVYRITQRAPSEISDCRRVRRRLSRTT